MVKRWLENFKVWLKARRIAKEIYGKGKSQEGQRQRYVRVQVAVWETQN